MHLNDWTRDGAASSPVRDRPSPDVIAPQSDFIGMTHVVRQAIADMAADRDLRRVYSAKAYRLAAAAMAMWSVLLGAQGAIKAIFDIEMWSDQVLIAVTTGVTVSVLAAFLGVIRGLFPGKDKEQEKNAS